MMKTFNHCSFRFLLYTTCVLSFLFPSLIFGEDAILEATRSEFQKIPIWVMGFSSVQQQDNKIPEQTDAKVQSILKDDLIRSQVFAVEDLPLKKGEFSENKCVSLSPNLETHYKQVTVSTWG